MNPPLVTVIVPVYNVEDYLRQCLDSIINQTYTYLEILLIDDGSTDGSGAICDEYAMKDKRIKVIHQQNQGISAARNAAMKIMKGEWVLFVDSDDWIELITVEECIKVIDENTGVEFIEFGFFEHYITHSVEWKGPERKYSAGKDALYSMLSLCGVYGTVWAKFIKASLLEDINFIEGRKYEDTPFIVEVLWKTKKYYFLPRSLYYYRRGRIGQITEFFSEKKQDMFYNVETLIEKYGEDAQKLLYLQTLYIFWLKTYFFEGLDRQKSVEFLLPYIKKMRYQTFHYPSRFFWLKWKAFLFMPKGYAVLVRKILPVIKKCFNMGRR